MGKIIKFLSILSLITFLYADNLNVEKRVYKQAIYDTYVLLNKFLQKGMDTTKLIQYDGKIVVALPADNLSTNDIIYYSTIATRNLFRVTTAFNQTIKRSFIVFGAYDREADANYALNQLRAIGIRAVKVYNGDWYNNPIVVANIINLLKDTALANFPTTVIEKTKYVYVTVPKIVKVPVYITAQKKQNNNIVSKTDKQTILKLITLITHLKKEGIPIVGNDGLIAIKYHNHLYKKGDIIDGFQITSTKIDYYVYKCRKYMKVIFKFDDFDNYHLIYRVPLKRISNTKCLIEPSPLKRKKSYTKKNKKNNTTINTCNPEAKNFINTSVNVPLQQKNTKSTNNAQQSKNVSNQQQNNEQQSNNNENQQSNNDNYYQCDLENIYAFYKKEDGEIITILKTYTALKDIKTVKVLKESEENYKNKKIIWFNVNGVGTFGIIKKAWDTVCKKQ